MHNASSKRTPTLQSAAVMVGISGQDAHAAFARVALGLESSPRVPNYATTASLKPGHSATPHRQKVCFALSPLRVVLWLASHCDNVEPVDKAKAELIGSQPAANLVCSNGRSKCAAYDIPKLQPRWGKTPPWSGPWNLQSPDSFGARLIETNGYYSVEYVARILYSTLPL